MYQEQTSVTEIVSGKRVLDRAGRKWDSYLGSFGELGPSTFGDDRARQTRIADSNTITKAASERMGTHSS